MKTKQVGFTLIELMIVVAIIGILAAVAIPAYKDYIMKSKVTEAMMLMSGFKTEIENYNSVAGHYPETLDSLIAVGFKDKGTYVTDIVYTKPPGDGIHGSSICLTLDGFDPTLGNKIGTALFLGQGKNGTPVSDEWRCKAADVPNCTVYLKDKYIPKNCRT